MNRFVFACLLACLLGACGSDSGSGPSRSIETAAATGELAYFNPTHLPSGYTIESTDVQDEGHQEGATWSAKLGRPDGAKKFRDLVTVFITASDPANEPDDKGYRPVDVNGHAGKESDSPIGAFVFWEEDGYGVVVLGPPGTLDDVRAVARAVRVSADLLETRLENVPAGFEVIAEWGSAGYPRKRYTINAQRADTEERIESVRIGVNVVPNDLSVALLGAGHETDASGEVRGRAAHVFRSANDIGGRTLEQFSLGWNERTDLIVTISGDVTVDEMRAVAEGLKEEPEPTWRAHMKIRTG